MDEKWECPECGHVNESDQLFCKNYPPTILEPNKVYCLGQNPRYWEMTKHWPSHRRVTGSTRQYLSSFD